MSRNGSSSRQDIVGEGGSGMLSGAATVTVDNPTLALSVSVSPCTGGHCYGYGIGNDGLGSLRVMTLCLRSRRNCATVRVAVDLLRLKSQFFDQLMSVKDEELQAPQTTTTVPTTPSSSTYTFTPTFGHRRGNDAAGDQDKESSEVITVPEEYPEEAAHFLVELHKVFPNHFSRWQPVWAELSRRWQVKEVLTCYSAQCGTQLSRILTQFRTTQALGTCVVVVNSKTIEANGIYELRSGPARTQSGGGGGGGGGGSHASLERYFEKQCGGGGGGPHTHGGVQQEVCFRIFQCALQSALSTTAPQSMRWCLGRFPAHSEHYHFHRRQELKTTWVSHAYIFTANFDGISFQSSPTSTQTGSTNNCDGMPFFCEADRWIDYSSGKISHIKVFTHQRKLSEHVAVDEPPVAPTAVEHSDDVALFWELAAFWLRLPTSERPTLDDGEGGEGSGNVITSEEKLYARMRNHRDILGNDCLERLISRKCSLW